MTTYTASQLVSELQAIIEKHGDIPVLVSGHSYQHGGTTCNIDTLDISEGPIKAVRICGIEVD